LQRFGSGSEPDPEPTREFGTVANTTGPDPRTPLSPSQSPSTLYLHTPAGAQSSDKLSGSGREKWIFPPQRVRTSVGRTWLPEASHCSLGWVSCFQLCLSVYSRGAYCICRPPTEPSLQSLLLRFVWSCSPPRCIFVIVLCLLCGPLSLDSLSDLLPDFRGCQYVTGPSGFLSLCRLCGDSLCIG
jgi:hypothetical protein